MKDKLATGAYKRYRQKQIAKADAEARLLMTSAIMVAIKNRMMPHLFWTDDAEKFMHTLLLEGSIRMAEC